MSLETIIIVSAVLEVVTLVCFFSLCSNVNSIKRKMTEVDISREDKFNFYVVSGQMDKAKDLLSKIILADSSWEHIKLKDKAALRDKAIQDILSKYKRQLEITGLSLDFDKINEF
jgi:hypothetical protein